MANKKTYMEHRYRIEYEANGEIKYCYPKSDESRDSNLKACEENGYKVIKVVKLYPFSTVKNQHNFMLLKNKCYNAIYEMDIGNIPYNSVEYDRLYELGGRASEFMNLELPVAWLDYNTLKEAKKLANMAIEWRVETCIRRGRYDLIQYC